MKAYPIPYLSYLPSAPKENLETIQEENHKQLENQYKIGNEHALNGFLLDSLYSVTALLLTTLFPEHKKQLFAFDHNNVDRWRDWTHKTIAGAWQYLILFHWITEKTIEPPSWYCLDLPTNWLNKQYQHREITKILPILCKLLDLKQIHIPMESGYINVRDSKYTQQAIEELETEINWSEDSTYEGITTISAQRILMGGLGLQQPQQRIRASATLRKKIQASPASLEPTAIIKSIQVSSAYIINPTHPALQNNTDVVPHALRFHTDLYNAYQALDHHIGIQNFVYTGVPAVPKPPKPEPAPPPTETTTATTEQAPETVTELETIQALAA